MDKVKILLSRNKLMELMALFSSFQKLLFFHSYFYIYTLLWSLSFS